LEVDKTTHRDEDTPAPLRDVSGDALRWASNSASAHARRC
jgi:hypothetical protein